MQLYHGERKVPDIEGLVDEVRLFSDMQVFRLMGLPECTFRIMDPDFKLQNGDRVRVFSLGHKSGSLWESANYVQGLIKFDENGQPFDMYQSSELVEFRE